MSDLLLQAIHRIPEGSIILVRSPHADSYSEQSFVGLSHAIEEKVGHDQFLVIVIKDDETWQVEPARAVHEQLGRFLAKIDSGTAPS